MRNNDVLRSLRWTLDASDAGMADLFALGGAAIDRATVAAYLRRDDEDGFLICPDTEAAAFLSGLIVRKRGPSDKKSPAAGRLTNNLVLKLLRIAWQLRDEDVAAILKLGGFPLSMPEINALFRAEGHTNYRPCGDQVLRNFLRGLTLRVRP